MIGIGSDHRGFKLKEELKKYLKEELNVECEDFGTYSEERVDTLPIVGKLCKNVQEKNLEKGILICGTGFAMAFTANKFKRIIAVNCVDEFGAKRSREHNNSNILTLGAEAVDIETAKTIVKAWFETDFLGGRYAERQKMLEDLEDENFK